MRKNLDIDPRYQCAAKKLAAQIYKTPEKGFYEETATKLFADCLEELGLKVTRNIARTGCIATVELGGSGPRIAIIAELDAIKCRTHPASGSDGYAHCCGHNLQVATMYMLASKLMEWKQEGSLCGTVDIIGVPSEEYIDLSVKEELQQRGEIQYFGGKQELIRKGYFDHVDIAMITHNMPADYMGTNDVVIGGAGLGFSAKKVEFFGREAHAGMHPEEGVNALQAMVLALNNINAIRDTFQEKHGVRVHYIMTNGGETVNVVPGYSSLEMHVRSKELNSLNQVSAKVNNCFQAASLAVGCDLSITESPGYLPGVVYQNIAALCKQVSGELVGENQVAYGFVAGAASDFGDVTQILTTLKIATGGIAGSLHAKDFKLVDFEKACVLPAKVLGSTIWELLRDQGALGKKMVEENKHNLTKDTYLQLLDQYSRKVKYHYMCPEVYHGADN